MSEPFIAEIKPFGFSFAPRGWSKCDGQVLAIAQNTALFALVGTTYGGDGRTTFALPDLRGRVPMGSGQGAGLAPVTLGQKDGVETVALTQNQMPDHDHSMNASSDTGTTNAVTGKVLATPGNALLYGAANNLVAMNPASVPAAGGGQPHDNMQPFLTLNYCIALRGIFPSRN